MHLKELRKSLSLSQKEASLIIGMPLRTYQNYENDPSKVNSIKYNYATHKLEEYAYIDETTGILTLDQIKKITTDVFTTHDVTYAYLFGSYARGEAREDSDIDILIETTLTGLDFYGLVETLRTQLKKKVDLLDLKQLGNNLPLTSVILSEGIKIYESRKKWRLLP